MNKTDNDIAEELDAIRLEIKELLGNAERLVRGTREESRAGGYWIAHISMALDKEHGYLGGSMVTMQDTINAFRGDEGDDDESASEFGRPHPPVGAW